jgi:hypothetical protein
VLEIFILIALGKAINRKAQARGWPGWPWVVALVIGWFVALMVGGIAAGVLYMMTSGNGPAPGANPDEPPIWVFLIGAYLAAACMATGLFIAVGFLPRGDDPDGDDEEEDYRPARRPRRDVDDDDPYHPDRYRRE